MSIHNNFPAISWIKLDGISVTKDEDVYIVKDFKTNLKYIYWCLDNPTELTSSNVMLSRTSERFLIAVNDKGECILVPNDNIVVSFDGNSVDSITEHIWGLHEKDSEYGNRFVSVEQNIEGITQTVGQHREDIDSVSEYVSKVDQKADEINLSVKEVKKEYSDDKQAQELRESVNKSIIDINSTLGIFKSSITDIFKDNKISDEEDIEIKAQIDILLDRKNIVLDNVNRISLLIEMDNRLQDVVKLNSQKEAFVNSIDGVVSLVQTAISDKMITPTEITTVTNIFAKASAEVNILKNTIDEIILLGIGGTISEELSRISMKSDEIVLGVHKVEEKIDNDTAKLKTELSSQINDVSNALNGLEDNINGAFLDGVLSESEKISLKSSLQALNTEKLDVDKEYSSIYNNANLSGTYKTNLKTAYDSYTSKYNQLVNGINSVINKSGNVSVADQSNINSYLVAYRNALGDFTEKISSAIDSISSNKVGVVDNKYSEILLSSNGIVSRVGSVESQASSNSTRLYYAESEIEQLADSITSKVSRGDVKSIIQQSPTEIRYGFNDISDYVTIGTYGLTVTRGSISCDSITSHSSNPIIRLFEGNGLNCAIDATAYKNEGVGSAIRLKRDNNNYIYVGKDNVAFYCTGSNNNESALCWFSGDTNNLRINSKGGNLTLDNYNNRVTYNGTALSKEGHTHSYFWDSIQNKPSFGTSYGQFAHGNHTHSGYSPSGHGHDILGTGGAKAITEYASVTDRYTLRKHTSSGMDLGTTTHRWDTVYSSNSLNTSDRKFKENICYLDEKAKTSKDIEYNSLFLDFIKNNFRPATFVYSDKGRKISNNTQIGFIANDIADTEVGKTFIYDFNEDGYMFSPTGYTTVVAKALQEEISKREHEVTALKEENSLLKDEISDLNNKLNDLTNIVNELINTQERGE